MERALRRRVCGALAAALLATVAIAPATTAADPDDRVAYARILGGAAAAILTANPDGSDEREVPLEIPAEEFSRATWSPDHEFILVSNSLRFDEHGEFLPFRPAIVRPDGSDYRLLPLPDAPFDAFCPAWSADGTRIYCSFGGDEPGVFSVRASDGGDVRRLTTAPFVNGGDVPVDVSPDGSQILVLRKRPGPEPDAQPYRPELYALLVMNADGSDQRQIVPYGITHGHEIGSAHWSPDGRTIISTNTRGRLFTVRPDGKDFRYLKLGIDGFAFMPNFSPDGSRIVFGLFGPTQEDLFTADPDGRNVEPVTDTPDFEHSPDWR